MECNARAPRISVQTGESALPYILLTARRNQQLSHCKQNNFARFLSPADYYFEKVEINLSGITANYQTGMLKVGTSGLVWVQTVSLNVFIANTKQGVGPQVFPTLVTALPLQYTYKALHRQWRTYLSRDI